MSENQLIEAEVDLERNLIRSRYSGHPTKSDMESGAATLRAALMQMKPGFTILADWSKLEGMELDCAPYITEIMDVAHTQGAGLVVRVLPAPVHHLRGSARTVTADNLEHAERLIQ